MFPTGQRVQTLLFLKIISLPLFTTWNLIIIPKAYYHLITTNYWVFKLSVLFWALAQVIHSPAKCMIHWVSTDQAVNVRALQFEGGGFESCRCGSAFLADTSGQHEIAFVKHMWFLIHWRGRWMVKWFSWETLTWILHFSSTTYFALFSWEWLSH